MGEGVTSGFNPEASWDSEWDPGRMCASESWVPVCNFEIFQGLGDSEKPEDTRWGLKLPTLPRSLQVGSDSDSESASESDSEFCHPTRSHPSQNSDLSESSFEFQVGRFKLAP